VLGPARILQDHPRLLGTAYAATHRLLRPFRRWLRPGGGVEWAFVQAEKVGKGFVFDCRMCGQCVLHSTGMTCPMTCPKNMRNGPCGGVRLDGHCEILSEMPCVWTQAWERTTRMPRYGDQIRTILPPLDRRLEGTSAWINDYSGAANRSPAGWNR
jgi:hypothetical protein